jgi:hypothetical protein
MPGAIVDLLLAHRESQAVERQRAAQLWSDEGWIFADETGRAINPRTDWDNWKRLLATAGVRDGRLHDARHTAATALLLLGVHEGTIMSVLAAGPAFGLVRLEVAAGFEPAEGCPSRAFEFCGSWFRPVRLGPVPPEPRLG